ncbi:endosome-associated-trafficking regulator 1 [Diorhabda sublineata]|uniref:endosome-associated-trafficking regulator 1 n=1 Tax=Diorhabda sublineata TaxID=1163346 RepID=UPI0024E14D72|nr:endosome-associated-trafficking regulator 1 [Diorhabda sublineata]
MAEENLSSKHIENKEGEDNSDSEPISHMILDLGDDSPFSLRESNRLGNSKTGVSASGSSTGDSHKREDNPFSFKHFLESVSTDNYQAKGARPKVYENRSASSDYSNLIPESKPSRLIPEYPSALPDFVQDHLVIEQCYLRNNSPDNYNGDMNNLPDFTPGRINRNNGIKVESTSNKPVPLDLPIRNQDFPLDLPLPNSGSSRNVPTASEVGNSKSLPDFLTDSAVCDTLSAPHSPQEQTERLRNELDITKRQLLENQRLCDNLSRELEIARNKEHEYTQNLARALEKVEDNLEKSNKRATTAEALVSKLKQEIKSLTNQLNIARAENQSLKGEEAAGGHGYYNSSNQLHYIQLAQELRTAASTAEHSLRQLLTGVDNLRIMAASIENMHRIEETRDPFSNFDEDAGPAL